MGRKKEITERDNLQVAYKDLGTSKLNYMTL